jgi:choline dehydrogenase-like flavoprotein
VGLVLQTAGVGGTTLHYNGISARAYPSAIADDWPLTYEELVPYYERVEAFLPVRQVEEAWLATKDWLFGVGCEKTGLVHSESKDIAEPVWRRAHNAILPVARMTPGGTSRSPTSRGAPCAASACRAPTRSEHRCGRRSAPPT